MVFGTFVRGGGGGGSVAIGRLYIYIYILRIVLLSWDLCIMCGTGRHQWLE